MKVKFLEGIEIFSGKLNHIIVDFQRGAIHPVPIDLVNVINDFSILNIDEIESKYTEHSIVLKEYIDFLIEMEFAIIVNDDIFNSFLEISKDFNYPSQITNAIIAADYIKDFNLLSQLEALNCYQIEIQFFSDINQDSILKLCSELDNYSFENVSISIQYCHSKTLDLIKLLRCYFFINTIYVFNSNRDEVVDVEELRNSKVVYLKSQGINKSCGCANIKNLTLSKLHFFESLSYNSCLNRKVSVDSDGNIKNCPSMKESYGNIKDTTLAEAIEKPGFKKYWDINKDKIHVCKDCEFRYICTDCRAYVEDPDDILSKPLKCGYNPYTGEWSEWSTNPLKQKAIDFYGMREMVEELDRSDS